MSLKDITKDLHHAAEITQFAQTLLSGKISSDDYAKYLYQMLLVYGPIEASCERQGFLQNLKGVERAHAIYQDFTELAGKDFYNYTWLPSTVAYHLYLLDLIGDADRKHLVKAHMYVRHMGDLFGGQIIKKQVAHVSSGKFYDFKNVEELKTAIRAELTDDLGDEARVAFQHAINIMRELNNE